MNTLPMQSEFTTGQVAAICGTTHSHVRRWVQRGKLAGYLADGENHLRIPRDSLLEFLSRTGRLAAALDRSATTCSTKQASICVLPRRRFKPSEPAVDESNRPRGWLPGSQLKKLAALKEPLPRKDRLPLTDQVREILESGSLTVDKLRELSRCLKAIGISQEKFSCRAGYCPQAVSLCIRGRFPITIAFEMGIRRAFGLETTLPESAQIGGAE